MAGKVQNVPGSGHSSRVKERRAAGPLSGKGLRSAVRTFLLIVPPVFAAGVFAVGVWYIIAVGPATAMLRAIGVSYAENPLGTVATFGLVVILLLVICGLIWRTKTVMGRRRPVVVSDSPFRGVGPWGTRAYVTGASSPMPREMAAVSKVYGATVAQVVVARSLPGDGRKMVMARAADIARHRFKTGLTIEGLARHEAAHVVVCHFTGGTVVSSDIYGQEKGAVTKYTHAGLEHMEYSEAVWCAMVTTAAGHVADQLEGDPNFSSTPDLVALNGLAYVFLAAGIEPPGIRSRHALRTLKGTGHGWLSSSPGSV